MTAVIPVLAELIYWLFSREPLEISVRQPEIQLSPLIDKVTLGEFDFFILIGCLIIGSRLLKANRKAWYSALILLALTIAFHLVATVHLRPDSTGFGMITSLESSIGLYITLVICISAIYLLTRKDARYFFSKPISFG